MIKMGSVIAVPITMAFAFISTRPSDIITYFKWLVSYIYIEVSRRMGKKRLDLYDMEAIHDPFKTGFLPPQIEYDLESRQSESHLLNAADEIFFYGVNSHSECLIIRIARTVNDEAEAWIYLKLGDGKVYQLKETSGYQHPSSDNGRDFTCGGLRINCKIPMRLWRIFYNGLLRETSEQDETSNKIIYIRFALIWRASSDCFDMTSDVNSAALAMGFSKSKWKSFKPPLEKLYNALNFYAQSGTIKGTVQVGEDPSDRNLHLFGERTRFLGETNLEKGAEFVHILGQVSKTGYIFHLAEATIPGVVTNFQFGFVVFSTGEVVPISDTNMVMKKAEEDKNIRAIFHADGLEFEVKGSVDRKQAHFENKKGWDGSLSIDKLNIDLNDLDGSGVLIKGKIVKTSQRKVLKDKARRNLKDIPMAVHFSEDICEISEVTGGKGSSLGKLTHLSKELQNFIVPKGIVVTTSAYEEFLNDHIIKEIRNLEAVLYGNVSGDVKEACQRVMNEVIKANLPKKVSESVICLLESFGDQLHVKKFAIRSSATGEDTEQMSAAGQMETYLGITGLKEIMHAVKKCWASQFGFVAVQYKRQNGQVLNSPMAVVIQEMISCDVAGVLFTCDPLTGNPTKMSITANYGLGESVVSGSAEPDTIMLGRNEKDELEIKDKIIGAKSHRIVIKEDEGTRVEDVSQSEKNTCCLTDILALRLGNVAIQIEKFYRSKRDIEWGFWNNNLYIFQSRPVTSGTGETDYEIDHEMDCPMRIENDFFTVCNVGEVMPGAMSPLGLDVVFKFFELSVQRRSVLSWKGRITPKYYPKSICSMYNHVMFYAVNLFARACENKEHVEALMIAMFGRVLDDKELYEAVCERYGRKKEKTSMFTKKYRLLMGLIMPSVLHKRASKHYTGYRIPVETLKNSQEAFDYMVKICDDCSEAVVANTIALLSSSTLNMMILSKIGKARGGIDLITYNDFSRLLSSISGIESADVPFALQSLAYSIGKEIKTEEFKKMDSEKIAEWLKTSPSVAGIKFQDFLSRHGHRCLKEFDMRSTTWGADPTILIELLKNLVGSVQDSEAKRPENPSEIISALQLGFKDRMALKVMLPLCRNAVQKREATKSLLIKVVDCWRKGYQHLSKLMVSEGRIPDEDIIYFMCLEEIKELLTNRSPKIISRANHRRRRHPGLDKLIFPEVMKSYPQPVNLYDAPIAPTADNFTMKGIPVSQGVARGYVRVALTLEEASHLKQGEILLTYSTDIGWTPYFPAVAGVVTELGGLISHGAVVSREYGLPCIAGLHGATRQFQTGDYVLLDGNKGILQKISPPDS